MGGPRPTIRFNAEEKYLRAEDPSKQGTLNKRFETLILY